MLRFGFGFGLLNCSLSDFNASCDFEYENKNKYEYYDNKLHTFVSVRKLKRSSKVLEDEMMR